MNEIIEIKNMFWGIPLIKVSYVKTQTPFINNDGSIGALINDISFEICAFTLDNDHTPSFDISIVRDPMPLGYDSDCFMVPRHPKIIFPERQLSKIRDYILKRVYP